MRCQASQEVMKQKIQCMSRALKDKPFCAVHLITHEVKKDKNGYTTGTEVKEKP